ncbi:hypothetical protein M0811_14317 [Anaeramoeba ignava]|uniref:Uncharacterized protein n=1 Tax=Anaeramoeba ignava TaxID=1746090 RepID=A0A9Q0LW35_ANAIG|nr:hypothetical protein M0811_14317 [Anaeramoeba ignava]
MDMILPHLNFNETILTFLETLIINENHKYTGFEMDLFLLDYMLHPKEFLPIHPIKGKSKSKKESQKQEVQKMNLLGSKKPSKQVEIVDDYPIVLVCSKWLQVLPWEELFEQNTVRSFSGLKFANLEQISNDEELGMVAQPHYFTCYSLPEISKKFTIQKIRQQQKSIYKELVFNLHHSDNPNLNGKESQNKPPFHSPLVKYGTPKKTLEKITKYYIF